MNRWKKRRDFSERLVAGPYKDQRQYCIRHGLRFSTDFPDIDDDFYEEIEEILVMGDLGINATTCYYWMI